MLNEYKLDVIVVNGTRIISKKILQSTKAIFINIHMGITPKYRGVHGGYWALHENDAENAGVTIHLIDEGIDIGSVLLQTHIECCDRDNFCSYPYLQLGEGLKLEIKVLNDIANNTLIPQTVDLPSILWSHPTIYDYLKTRFLRKVK